MSFTPHSQCRYFTNSWPSVQAMQWVKQSKHVLPVIHNKIRKLIKVPRFIGDAQLELTWL